MARECRNKRVAIAVYYGEEQRGGGVGELYAVVSRKQYVYRRLL